MKKEALIALVSGVQIPRQVTVFKGVLRGAVEGGQRMAPTIGNQRNVLNLVIGKFRNKTAAEFTKCC